LLLDVLGRDTLHHHGELFGWDREDAGAAVDVSHAIDHLKGRGRLGRLGLRGPQLNDFIAANQEGAKQARSRSNPTGSATECAFRSRRHVCVGTPAQNSVHRRNARASRLRVALSHRGGCWWYMGGVRGGRRPRRCASSLARRLTAGAVNKDGLRQSSGYFLSRSRQLKVEGERRQSYKFNGPRELGSGPSAVARLWPPGLEGRLTHL